jgi:hypothetical protein
VILLDTDHWTVLKYSDSERYARLHARLLAVASEPIGTTIVNVEEQMRGWLSAIAKERTPLRQITAYRELTDLFDFFSKLHTERTRAFSHSGSRTMLARRVSMVILDDKQGTRSRRIYWHGVQ